MKYVYVVSYEVPGGIEPTVTVFDNEEPAQTMYDYIKSEKGYYVWLDVCPLYHGFEVKE